MGRGGRVIVGIGMRDAAMTQANSGTVVDCAKYYAVRRVAWLGRMVFAGIVGRRGPMHPYFLEIFWTTLFIMGLLAARLMELVIMGLLVIACVITVVSARDHDLLQAIWLAATRYVTSGQRIIALCFAVTECACSAGCVVFRSAHNAGELAPSVSGYGIIDELRERQGRQGG